MALTQAITSALAPGVALTSGIFYYNGLAARFANLSNRVRDLNREARSLQASGDQARLESVRVQVAMLTRRVLVVQRAILGTYIGLICFILAMILLMVLAWADAQRGFVVPLVLFAIGLCSVAYAMITSLTEVFLSTRTLLEDVRSSHPPGEGTQKPAESAASKAL